MNERLPFDEKNAQDFLENTRKINEALQAIEGDSSLSASKANLARLSGLNRNTLYNRALMNCPAERKGKPNAANLGWPYKRLLEIKKARSMPSAGEGSKRCNKQSVEQELTHLKNQLDKSRHVAGAWFNRTLELKKERDAARREAELLRKQLSERTRSHTEDIDRLRKQLQKTIKAVDV